jgi:uncharacterized protein YutE (UPF0331/DUF86 family)
MPNMRNLESVGVYERSELLEIDRIRRLRNLLVHGISSADSRDLNESADLLKLFTKKLQVKNKSTVKGKARLLKKQNRVVP